MDRIAGKNRIKRDHITFTHMMSPAIRYKNTQANNPAVPNKINIGTQKSNHLPFLMALSTVIISIQKQFLTNIHCAMPFFGITERKKESGDKERERGKNEKGRVSLYALPLPFSLWCPGLDSNQHILANAAT